jgi:hypothetical protein
MWSCRPGSTSQVFDRWYRHRTEKWQPARQLRGGHDRCSSWLEREHLDRWQLLGDQGQQPLPQHPLEERRGAVAELVRDVEPSAGSPLHAVALGAVALLHILDQLCALGTGCGGTRSAGGRGGGG